MQTFDALYFISDLHLGGEPGRQVFNQGAKLGQFIRHVAARDPERRVALVLGGDIIDFLAFGEPYLKATGEAVRLLDRVLGDGEFAPIFAALAALLRTPGRHLILLLGNHDLELVLPAVRERLTAALCEGSDEARGRLSFLYEEGGLRCQVGPARIVCTHGNEADPWNLVDYAALVRHGADEERGLAPQPFTANAGTRLVIDVMNKLKNRFPFIELLKPEGNLVPRILAVLDPEALEMVSRFAPIAYRLLRGVMHQHGFLGAELQEEASNEAMLNFLLNPPSEAGQASASSRTPGDPLEQATRFLREGKSAHDLVETPPPMLGLGQYILDRWRGIDEKEALRRALADWLGDEQTVHAFDIGKSDYACQHLTRTVGPDVHFLIAGHTHLARAVQRPDGGYYFNAGTWMRIVRLERAEDLDSKNFADVYDALTRGTLTALDDARPQIVHTRPTVVVVEAQAGGAVATGTLAEFHCTSGAPTLSPIGGPFTISRSAS